MIQNITSAIKTKLASSLTYASDSGYEDANIDELVQSNKYPFFNVLAEGWEIDRPNGMSRTQVERWTVSILIQFAVRALKVQEAKQGSSGRVGIYEMAEDIWTALKNETLSGEISGILPQSSVAIDVIESEGNNERYFIGAAEMRIKAFKDIGF